MLTVKRGGIFVEENIERVSVPFVSSYCYLPHNELGCETWSRDLQKVSPHG